MPRTARILNLAPETTEAQSPPDPDKKKVGKFVIIQSDDVLQLVHGPIDDYSYHADLVKKFCDLNSIPSGWLKKPDLYEIYGNSHHIKGGGWVEEKTGEKRLSFFGYSTAYGRFETEDMVYLLEQAPELADYEITIED